jgi:predicted DCC family thiol-disulfide oxidoreductase YuxK
VVADAVYGLVARVRYRLFGRFDACALPTPAERARFI